MYCVNIILKIKIDKNLKNQTHRNIGKNGPVITCFSLTKIHQLLDMPMQYQLNSDAEVSVRQNKDLKVWAALTIAKCSS